MPLTFRPKLEKIVELLLYLAHKRAGADKYQAVKFFYLADREHFKPHGRPLTFDNYYALSYGPVASNALDLLHKKPWMLQRAGIKELPFETEIGTSQQRAARKPRRRSSASPCAMWIPICSQKVTWRFSTK
jgi:hypothetical protein